VNTLIRRIPLLMFLFAAASTTTQAAHCTNPADNAIRNHSFELATPSSDPTLPDNPTNWNVAGGAFWRQNVYQECGRYYGLLYRGSNGVARAYQDVSIPTGSISVNLTAYAGIHSRANQQIRLIFLDSRGVEMRENLQQIDVRKVVPGLRKYELTSPIPEGAKGVRVEGRLERTSTQQGEYLKLDMVTLLFEERSLPVTLSSFHGIPEAGSTRLNWQTTEEVNAGLFEVQHSENATEWSALGTVEARGQVLGISNYFYVHTNPKPGINYYRLRIVDQDDTFAFSSAINVQNDRSDRRTFPGFYPNPTDGKLHFTFNRGVRELQVFDPLGNRIYRQHTSGENGSIDLSRLSNGVYLIRWEGEDGEGGVQRIVLNRK
jgi:hypothetical protein